MKTKIYLLIIAFIVASCGNPNKTDELAALKKQYDEIGAQMQKLEAEIANDTTLVKEDKSTLVAVQKIETSEFNHFIEVQGKLDGDENLAVSTPIGGNIQSVNVKVGQSVSKGQILAKLDDKVLVQSIKELETQQAFATDMYNKQKALWDQKIGSEVQYLNAKNQKESLDQRMATMKNQLDMMHVSSPINGTVEEVIAKIGQLAVPGYPLFRVVNFNQVKVTADVAESYASKIHQGDDVIVFFPDINIEIKAKISFVSKYIDQVDRTFNVEINLSGAKANLKANMVAILKINDYSNAKAVSLPVNYIQTDKKGPFVYIVNNAKDTIAEKSYIETGIIYNGNAEITKGLKSGDYIISAGYLDVEDGVKVRY